MSTYTSLGPWRWNHEISGLVSEFQVADSLQDITYKLSIMFTRVMKLSPVIILMSCV